MSYSNFYCSTDNNYRTTIAVSPNNIIDVEGDTAHFKHFSPLSNDLGIIIHDNRLRGRKTADYEFFIYRSPKGRPMLGIKLRFKDATHALQRSKVETKLHTAQKLAKDLKGWIARHA
jgi:hypothetical protein